MTFPNLYKLLRVLRRTLPTLRTSSVRSSSSTLLRAAALGGAVVIAPALTACGSLSSPLDEPAPPRVETAPNQAWVRVSGRIATAGDHRFVLDYGEGRITVEMDDFSLDADGRALLADDDVVVYGYVDDDFYERRTIEASSVYVRGLGTQFYASGIDEEDFPVVAVDYQGPEVEVSGTVVSVSGRELQLDTGAGTLQVDTIGLGYDPLDDEGYQRVEPGDRIRVIGNLDSDVFDNLQISADVILSVQTNVVEEEAT